MAKSRRRNFDLATIDDYGGYRIIDVDRNVIVAGERFDLSLEDTERWVAVENYRSS